MWTSWFGGFAEPSDYANAEMPDINIRAVIISSIFVVPYLAFLIILPGVREKRIVTLLVFTVVTLIGAILAASMYLPGWAGGSARILAQLRSHFSERTRAHIGVNVGLKSINITLRVAEMVDVEALGTRINMTRLYYNENFDISGVSSMTEELRLAYLRGLPYPILSVLEYFSLNQDAFDWGRHYRTAGHYTSAAVSLALSCWALAVVFLLLVPHHFGMVCFTYFIFFLGMAMLATGVSALLACLVYLVMSPCQLQIGFVGVQSDRILMRMSFQWAFYAVFAAGLLAVLIGLLLIILQHYQLYTLSTFLDARLDKDVSPATCGPSRVGAVDFPDNSQVVHHSKNSGVGSMESEKKTSSSGFQSHTSCTGSMRSQSSIESVHGELPMQRSPSNLTINDEHRPQRESRNDVIVAVERF